MFDPSAPVQAYRRPAEVPAGWARCAACGDLVPAEMAGCCIAVDGGRHFEQMLCFSCYEREVDEGASDG